MNKKVIQIALDDDTAEFLELARCETTTASISDFINSLLRQERFRQGFPAHQGRALAALPAIASLSGKLLAQRRGF